MGTNPSMNGPYSDLTGNTGPLNTSSSEANPDIRHHLRPHLRPHHHPHHKPAAGLNSLLSETLDELSPTFRDIKTIEAVVRELDADALPIFTRVSAEGIADPVEFVERFLEVEASERLTIRDLMLSDVRQNQAIALFPLPPYITEILRPALSREFSFNTTEHPQVHIQRDKIQPLDYGKYRKLFNIAHNVSSLILDGKRHNQILTLRPNTASILELLLDKSLKRIFIHKIPHLPHGDQFVTLDVSSYEIEIYNI